MKVGTRWRHSISELHLFQPVRADQGSLSDLQHPASHPNIHRETWTHKKGHPAFITVRGSMVGSRSDPGNWSLLDCDGVQPSAMDMEGGLVTPAQQREPQRPSTHKSRPPPLDTTQQGLAAAPFAAGPLGGLLAQLASSSSQHPATAGQVVHRCPLACLFWLLQAGAPCAHLDWPAEVLS